MAGSCPTGAPGSLPFPTIHPKITGSPDCLSLTPPDRTLPALRSLQGGSPLPSPPLTLPASPPSPLPSDCLPCSYPVPPWTSVTAFLSKTFRVQTPQVLSLCVRMGKGHGQKHLFPAHGRPQSQVRYMLYLLSCINPQRVSICASSHALIFRPKLPSM